MLVYIFAVRKSDVENHLLMPFLKLLKELAVLSSSEEDRSIVRHRCDR